MRLRAPGLITRLALGLGVVGLAPLALLSFQLVGENRAALTTQVLRTHAVAARAAAERTHALLEPLRSLAAGVAANPILVADPRSDASKAILGGLLEGRDAVAGVALVSPEGLEYIRVQRRDQGPLVGTMLAARSPGPLAHRQTQDGVWVRVASPFAETGGSVEIVAEASVLAEIVRTEEIGEEAVLAIADAGAGLVAASSPEVQLESFPAELVAAARAGRVSGSGRFRGPDGREVLGAWAPVPGSGWFVVSRQPVTVAEAVAARLRRRSLVAVAFAVLLTAVLSAVAYRSVVRPIRGLVQAQRRLIGPAALEPPSGSEIDELRASFRILERRTRDREALGEVFLGRYQVLGVLGEGGMGTVFRGYDPKLQRPVALKTLRLGLGAPEDTLVRLASQLLHEAIVVARFRHPHIVGVYDVEDAPAAAFIAMELVDGTTLGRYLATRKRLPPDQSVPLGAAIARALEAAHAHGIVHHDVKPGNVLLGRDGAIKVTDFGIGGFVSSLTRGADRVFGTPGYLPPEALRGEGYDESGDIFALGAILYRCLTGQAAIPGKDPLEIAHNTVKGAVPMSERSVSVPEELEALVMGLLATRRELRTRTARQVAELLERMAARESWRWTPEVAEGDDTHRHDAGAHAYLVPTLHLGLRRRG